MTTYAWPAGFSVNRFEMYVKPNLRAFANAFDLGVQVLNLAGERWQVSLSVVPGIHAADGGALEAFIDRLQGPTHRVSLWNMRRPYPVGTLRDGSAIAVVNGSSAAVTVVSGSLAAVSVVSGTPLVAADLDAGANTATITTFAGRTVEAGDMLGIGGQLVRMMAASTANGSGELAVEFQPRMRSAVSRFSAVTWDKPTADFVLKGDSAPVTWSPGMYQGISADFVEANG